jgi:hypothetical protein
MVITGNLELWATNEAPQSIFMETPTRNALAKLSSNASLTRDASAPATLE